MTDSVTAPPHFVQHFGGGRDILESFSVCQIRVKYSAMFLFQGLSTCVHTDECLIQSDTM